ncbi:sulfate permease, SulP family [Paenimyroides ummariense]|uniref:Sulfate permease, SulP family n=1 Tax=Paenimyroides ummariense TaxID=913024 RepID=A0A1I5B220_9FLAO|nr:SulP family inorganic anion transporter [Paenimyroides ummariense]SFN68735.1 sulfate permease, SulP family [Paenimyroides ummariense]
MSFDLKTYRIEILAGLTVAMTMIPESLSFAIVAGLPPLTGLYGAFIMGIITAFLGGRPGMISGGAGATVIVMIALIATHGIEYFFAAVVLAGLFQVIVGIFKLGKFVRLVPQPVMYGFLNGLAVVIFMSQIEQFKQKTTIGFSWLQGESLYIMAGLVALTLVLVYLIPKISKALPTTLIAIAVIFGIVHFFNIDTKTVQDIASISGSLPPFHIPQIPLNLDTLQIIFPYAAIMAGVGLLESLLTLTLVDEVTETRGNANKESVAQGIANIANGFFTGMGGCAMIAQTFVNLNAGARKRISAIVSSLAILFIILVAAPVIEQIPMAALVGVMMMVAITTFSWGFFKKITKMPKSDILVTLIVAGITIVRHNLAIAVLVGIIISALVFAWESAKRIRARKYVDANGIKHYEIYGPLFFGSVANFNEKFDLANDPETIMISFKESRIADMSGIEAVDLLTKKYCERNKKVILTHLSEDSRKLLENASAIIKVNIEEDPHYKIPTDLL